MSLKMDKYQNIKAFNIAALEYIKNPSETTASVLQRNLSILSTTEDLSIFDPGTIVIAEFYASLYNLTNALASPIPLIWSVLDVLHNACRNSAARHAIHTYKYAPMLLRLLETNLITEKRSIESNLRLTELIKLLLEMSEMPNLRAQVIQAFSEQTMRRLLRPMLEQENLISGDNSSGNSIDDSATKLYIHALALTADLAVQNSSWSTLYSELIQKKQTQMMIALALFTGDGEVKQKCLQLMVLVSFPQECVTAVVKYMCELEPLVLLQSRIEITTGIPVKSENSSNIDMTPSFSLAQEGKLDAALEKINNLLADGKITDVTTLAVIKNYEQKLAAMKHAERGIQASLEAVNDQAAHLQHELAQGIAESSRLHQLLFYIQQNYKVLEADKIRMNVKLCEAKEKSKEIDAQRQKNHELEKNIAEKSAAIEQLSKVKTELEGVTEKIRSLETKIKDLADEKLSLESKTKYMLTKNHELNEFINKLQDNIAKKNQIFETKQKDLVAAREKKLALQQNLEQLMRQCQSCEKTIAEKKEILQRLIVQVDKKKIKE
ncbi:hypothetical protein PV325_007056 [Microctonus aethiopoides]|uniref:Protein CIP2A n=1 Tax=Microctonus aethiopoides TaxID=144406 RepID=A0AA39KRC9_9HYME|nr:hypothetical protein PV325_007056 [Microctonus aethiopoides]KAK0171025.1 hypothetical protein PV328_008792 [Microctonus aethiopoides]